MKHPSRTISSSLTGLVAAAALAVSPAALAQDGERTTAEQRLEKKLVRMERMVRERLSPRLALDDAQEEQLVRVFQESARARMQAMAAVKAERRALQELVERDASDAELSAQLQRLDDARAKLPERGALLDETAAFLTVEQQAKLALAGPGKHGKHGKHQRGMKERGAR